ncbi:metallophosphoesterase [Janibacter sp. Y6]|uniref:metallophosphoesterase n=1 Tax=Janibacter sp. Y6 TaxID=2913552 RepID=UPI0034A349BD
MPSPFAVRRVGGVVLTAVVTALVALVTGVVTTVLLPTTVSTDYYSAQVRLSPSWEQRSSISAETVVGSVSADFTGLAPGIEVEPQIREEVTDVVAGGRVSTTELVVGGAERARVIEEAAVGVGLRMAGGALLGAGAVLAVRSLWRRRRPGARAVVGTALVWGLTCAAVGIGAASTYREERFAALETTGLLRLAADNASLFTDVEERAGQAAPYLRNLLALSAALGSEYTPTEIATRPAVTVLLVSDIHASNQYALMRTIVQERDVDVVVDTGDLVNLGRVEELRLSRITRGIESLGVPYVFVRGNHDATSADDTALLDALSTVDDVVLPDPGDGSYALADVGGVRIAGFGDPRYYGDADDGSTEPQEAARDRWVEALGDAQPPDLTLSHEAPALADAPGRLRVHGHGHVPDVDGNRVALGTFTGGGTLSHFRLDEADQELVGQPSSFDLLTIDDQCRGQTLTRYLYRSVLEGRPSLDRVSVLNAARIMEPPAEGRTCGTGELSVRPLGD